MPRRRKTPALVCGAKGSTLATRGSGMANLFEAAGRGDVAAVGALLDAGADVDGVREEDERTALHCAAACGHAAVVTLLLERDADVDAEDEVRARCVP